MNFPKTVKIVEVGPRDGLQNEQKQVATKDKIEFINKLSETGLQNIEATSFVSPKWIPQLQDADEVYAKIVKHNNIHYSALVPNEKGFDRAINANVKDIAIFVAASESFSQKNINCSIKESLDRIAKVLTKAQALKLNIRGYISCTLGCPFEGEISPKQVQNVASKLQDLGCKEISLGDTIGVGTPLKACNLIETVAKTIAIENIAVHFHDTYGQALANIYATLGLGVRIIDSSIAGLGGCPYASGASGNVATEDVVYMLHGMNINTGIDLDKLLSVSNFVTQILGHPSRSKVALANFNKQY